MGCGFIKHLISPVAVLHPLLMATALGPLIVIFYKDDKNTD
jgi:hypothetical protein